MPSGELCNNQSTVNTTLTGLYTEMLHQGYLCCDYMCSGDEKVFNSDLTAEEGDAAFLKQRDRIRGAILCGAIGDAMGAQVESRSPGTNSPAVWYTPWRGWKSGPIGTITDDTQMTWWLAESLLKYGTLNPADVALRFTREHIRGIGQATRRFVSNFKDHKLPWYQSGVASSGNGAAMRAAPIGIFYRNDFNELKRAAGLQAMITHNEPMAIASSIVMAYATARTLRMNACDFEEPGATALFCRDLAAVINGIEVEDAYKPRRDGGKPSTLARRIGEDIPRYLEARATPAEFQKAFWSGAFVLESLPFALYCFLYSPGHFDRVLFNSVNESRDSDTVAAMACTLCGALNGLDKVVASRDGSESGEGHHHCDVPPGTQIDPDKDYLEPLEFKDELLDLADRLTRHAAVRPENS